MLCSLSVLLLLALPPAGKAQSSNPNELATNVAGTTTFAAPPRGFDALAASDERLADYGFPPRPDRVASPKQYASWAKAMLASQTRIVPRLEQTSIVHGPARLKQAREENGFSSNNWSGFVDLNGATRFGASSFFAIATQVVVPTALEAFGVCSGDAVYGSSWAGMDGAYSNDVLQAGIEFDAACFGGVTATLYSPWVEWYPSAEVRVTNLPANPGDDFYIEVWNTSATQGYAYLVNENLNEAASVSFRPPTGTKLIGNSAEWITERPQVNGGLATLTNYIADPFWSAYAIAHNSRLIDPGSSNAIIMVDSNGVQLSYPTLLGDSAFVMQTSSTAP